MKKILTIISLHLAILFGVVGCATTATSPDKTLLASATIRVATGTSASLVLAKNPIYAPAAIALADAVKAVPK